MVVAKVEDVWQRAVLVEMRPEGALVRLVDTDKEVMVEYRECKDLPDSLRSVPSAKVNVSLFGLESDGWNEVNAVRLLHILHLDVEVPTTPSMFIIVHSMENKVWEVSMLEEISRNHPVNIGALLVRKKLAKSMMAPARVVLSWGEARDSDLTCLGVVRDIKANEGLGKAEDEESVESDSDENNNYAGSTTSQQNIGDSAITRDYLDRIEVERVDIVNNYDRKEQLFEFDITENTISPDSGLEREDSKHSVKSQGSDTSDLPDRFKAMITTIEEQADKVWLVPSIMRGKQKTVNALLTSLSRRLPEPNTGVETGENINMGDDVLAWWEDDRCWFRARVVEVHPDMSTSVIFTDWGNSEQLPVGQVLLTRSEYPGYEVLRKTPGLAAQAMLYGVQMRDMDEDERTRLFNLMGQLQSATGSKDNMAEIIVCSRSPLQVQVHYTINLLNFNMTGVLVAHKFAEMKQFPVPGCRTPPPCPLPWQYNFSWPGHVTSVQHDQVWVQPVVFSDQYGLSDKDWYMDRFMQVLDSVGKEMESNLKAAYYYSRNASVNRRFLVGQTVIWCDMERQGQCFRGIVEDHKEEDRIRIFLPDTGLVQTVKNSSLVVCPAQLCAYPSRAVKVRLDSMLNLNMVTEEKVVLVTVLRSDLTVHMRIVDCLK